MPLGVFVMVADRLAPLSKPSFTPVTVTVREVPELLGVNVSDPGTHPGGAGIAARHGDGHVARGRRS